MSPRDQSNPQQQQAEHTRGKPPTSTIRSFRFTLNPHSSRDRRIAAWLASIPPYSRAEAVRSVLDDQIRLWQDPRGRDDQGRNTMPGESAGNPGVQHHQSSTSDPVAARKLRQMF